MQPVDFFIYLFFGGLILYIFYQLSMMFQETFFLNKKYLDDDERIYNPLTGKYYEVDFDGEQVIYEETINQQNSRLDEKSDVQKKFHTLRAELERSNFVPIIGEEEADKILVWLLGMRLTTSIIETSMERLFFRHQEILLMLFTGSERLDVGFSLVFSSKKIKGDGILTPKDELSQKNQNLLPSRMENQAFHLLNQKYHLEYNGTSNLEELLNLKTIHLLNSTDDLQVAFQNGEVTLFQHQDASQDNINSMIRLANELK